MRHTRNNTSNNGGLAAAAPASSSSALAAAAAAAAAAQSASSHLVSVHNQPVFSMGIDHNSCGQAVPLGAFPPARGQAAFVRHAAGDVTAAGAGSCCCFEGSGTGGREREARVGGGAREVPHYGKYFGGNTVVSKRLHVMLFSSEPWKLHVQFQNKTK